MLKAMKYVHLLGLVLFLGSILGFIVVSAVAAPTGAVGLAVARRVISAGTWALTMPGLACLAVSGVALAAGRFDLRANPWLSFKIAALLVIVINAALVILPAARTASQLAERALTDGVLSPAYARAYLTESIAGALNVLLALGAAAAGVWRFRRRRG
jgi:hypothetical protein